MVRMGLSLLTFCALVAVLVFFFVYQHHVNQYQSLRLELDREMEAAGHPVGAIHVLSAEDIENRLYDDSLNMTFFLLIACVLVSAFGVLLYHFLAGRHIALLVKLHRRTKSGQMVFYPESLIPANELGEALHSHNQMLVDIQDHNDGLEKNLIEARASMVHAAKLSAIGELTASISHDLKNPLSVILGYASVLQEGLTKGKLSQEKTMEILGKIIFAGSRIARMVGEMNRFVRKDTRFTGGNSVEELVHNAHLFIESRLHEKKIKFTEEIDLGATFWGDSATLEQVLINLFANACDAMGNREVRELSVRAKLDGERVEITVQDTGGGIPPEHLDKIFNAFFTTKPSGKGTGLGLSISQHIISEHRGQIRVESEPNRGTKFTLSLRVLPPDSASDLGDPAA